MRLILQFFLLILFLGALIAPAQAQCDAGRQLKENVCISQHMAEFIACVQSSGGNRTGVYGILADIIRKKGTVGASATAAGVVLSGGGSLNLTKESEDQFYNQSSVVYGNKAMEICREVLKDGEAEVKNESKTESKIIGADCYDPTQSISALEFKYKEFLMQVRNFEKEIGEPITCVKLVYRASKTTFQKKIELWTFAPSEFYLINPSDDSWEVVPELERCEEFSWCKDAKSRETYFKKLFKQRSIPTGYAAPFGATAVYLSRFPDKFVNIGWMRWNCEMNKDNDLLPTMYQKFIHGTVLGIYPISSTDKSGELYVLIDSGQIKTVHVIPVKVEGNSCAK